MKLFINALTFLVFLSSVYSYYIPNGIIKRKENNSTENDNSIKNNSSESDSDKPNIFANQLNFYSYFNSTKPPKPGDAFFRICTIKSGEVICDIIYEDETNGGSSCTDTINKECPLSTNFNEKSINSYCSTKFNTEKCKKIYTEGFSTVPECKNKNQKYLDILYENNIKKYTHNAIICTKDDDGNVCPYASFNFLRKDGQVNNAAFWKFINESCKSKSCMDIIPTVLEKEKEQFNDVEIKQLKEAVNFFETNQCTNDSIIQIHYKYSNMIICLFAVLLFAIF